MNRKKVISAVSILLAIVGYLATEAYGDIRTRLKESEAKLTAIEKNVITNKAVIITIKELKEGIDKIVKHQGEQSVDIAVIKTKVEMIEKKGSY